MTRILVVDDSATDRRLVGKLFEKQFSDSVERGLTVVFAESGSKASAVLDRERPDLVLTDLQMPGMSGLEVVGRVNDKYPTVPVILMTAYGSEEIAMQALKTGAASYVPKRHLASDLVQTVEDVLAVAGAKEEKQQLIEECWMQTQSHFMLPNDISMISPLICHLNENLTRTRICEENDLVRVAVALREALSNAILHGNLEIDSELREKNEEAYFLLLETRSKEEPFRSRQVSVVAEESRTEATYVIRDEGGGFDVYCLPDPTDPANLEKASGRGLLLIRTFMDTVFFNKKGNEITMVKRRR